MERPSNKQCKLARLLTGGKATDERIYKELNSMHWRNSSAMLIPSILLPTVKISFAWNRLQEPVWKLCKNWKH